MAVLNYQTRGGSSPQGKPRVYFCCHPGDFEGYFPKISDEILKKQNCAIWYPADRNVSRDEDFLNDLKQMQLFVMPVTTRLLTTSNPALETEFPFAVENHIPVLPLMQEGGLEPLFNEKCGDLQFLDPNIRDATAISYEEKLEKYLSSVLIGDELAEKIRAAFDAYVFLSYRKKDRKYARELMRLIHKNEFCRDIAIWYDEFLTPGENFNDSIRDALEKSGLFVLAVTPNLVNEINYIMTTEYPMAQRANKPILPAELVATDPTELARQYPGLPTPTDAYDEAALAAALLEKVRGLAIRENDDSPAHNFFIGLAYLGGVDVEVDHEKAVALITASAGAGLVEAMEKLVSMYREGLGVPRSYETAIAWQKRVARHYQRAYEASPTQETGYRCILELWHLSDYIYETRKLEEAKAACHQMLDFCQSFLRTHGPSPKISHYLLASRSKLATLWEAEGKLSQALEQYEASLPEVEQRVRETNLVEAFRDLMVLHLKIGGVCRASGRLEKALTHFQSALKIAERMGTVENPEFRRDIPVCQEYLGTVYELMGRLSEALAQYQASQKHREQLAEEVGTAQSRRDLAVGHSHIGDICHATGQVDSALAHYQACLEIVKGLAEETGALEARKDLSFSYTRIGNVYNTMGKADLALEQYETALRITTDLARETDTPEARRDLALSYGKVGNIYLSTGRLDLALERYEAALQLRTRLAEETGTLDARRDLLAAYSNTGSIYNAMGKVFYARTLYQAALDIALQLAQETGTAQCYDDLAVLYYNLGRIAQGPKQQEYYRQALSIWETLTLKYPENPKFRQRRDTVKRCLT